MADSFFWTPATAIYLANDTKAYRCEGSLVEFRIEHIRSGAMLICGSDQPNKIEIQTPERGLSFVRQDPKGQFVLSVDNSCFLLQLQKGWFQTSYLVEGIFEFSLSAKPRGSILRIHDPQFKWIGLAVGYYFWTRYWLSD